jgi:hypothetical protein
VFTSWYKSNNQRYNNYFAFVGNKLKASENGGIQDDEDYLNDPIYNDRFNIPTKLGGDNPINNDFYKTKIGTGNKHTESTILMRQQYDLGRKDSIVTDSTVIPLFYPRLRFEHTLSYSSYKYVFEDGAFQGNTSFYTPDSTYYQDNYGLTLNSAADTVYFRESWKELINDFSIYQFPDAKTCCSLLSSVQPCKTSVVSWRREKNRIIMYLAMQNIAINPVIVNGISRHTGSCILRD